MISLALPSKTEAQACWELCRLHNNIGFWVVWIPTAWSIFMVYHAQPQLSILSTTFRAIVYVPLCFGIKSFIMTIDDILDYDIDALVERTKCRPIPRGSISLPRAWLFLCLQVILGVYSAFSFLSPKALYISMFVWPLYLIYPTCKRWMSFAPIPLGLMFNVGIFMGWADLSIDGSVSWNILTPLYLGACLWTVTYETVYQHQDKFEDIKIGVKSPALFFEKNTYIVCAIASLSFLGLTCYSGILNNQGLLFYTGVIIAGIILITQLLKTDIDVPEDAKRFFLLTPFIGRIILGGLVMDTILGRWRNGLAF